MNTVDSSTVFQLQLTTHIRFGSGQVDLLPGLPEVRGKRCMLLCYPGLDRPALRAGIQSEAASVILPDVFEENPSYALAERLGRQVREESIGTIIAIGGGSTIDSAKAAAWFGTNPQTPADAKPRPAEAAVVAVPTTAGTGSEVTPYAILTDTETGNKKILKDASLVPRVALCDPQLTATMPPRVTAHTGLDALSHAVEGYFSKPCQGLLADLALAGCRRIAAHLPTVLAAPDNLTARQEVMLAALGGGIVLAHCGTVIVHALGYNLTREFGYTHGLSNALLLAGFVAHLADRGSPRAAEVMECFDGDPGSFIRRCGVEPLLARETISRTQRDEWLENAYHSYGRPNCVLPLQRNDIDDILIRAMALTE